MAGLTGVLCSGIIGGHCCGIVGYFCRNIYQALEEASNIIKNNTETPEVISALLTPDHITDEEYNFLIHTLKEFGQGKVGYIPDVEDFLQADHRQNDFVVKFLVRYFTLKNIIRTFDPYFTMEQIAQEVEKSTASEKHERENEAVEAIGRKYYPNLFISDYLVGQKHGPDILEVDLGLEKHEWLGSQAQLAELHIELLRKGWIKQLKVKTIKASFTKSASIDQILKPGYDRNEPTFPQVLTENYRQMFKDIKQNKKAKG